MLKKTLFLTLIVVSAASISYGSTTRLQSLLVRGFIEDDSDIFINPALVAFYPNRVIGELGTYPPHIRPDKNGDYLQDQWLGLTFGREPFAGGLVLNRAICMVDEIAAYEMRITGYPFNHPIEPINPIELMGAYQSNGMAIGGRLYRSGAGSTEETDMEQFYGSWKSEITRNSGVWDLAGGMGMDLGGENKLDGYVNLGLFSFNTEYEVTVTDTIADTTYIDRSKDQSEGGKYIGFGGRAFFSMTRRIRLVPLLEFSTMSFTEKAEEPGTTHPEIKNSEMSFKAGVGINSRFTRRSLFAIGLSVLYSSEKKETEDEDKTETTSWTLPLFQAGLETYLTKWFIARIGVQKAHMKVTEKYTAEGVGLKQAYESTQTYSTSPLDFLSLGFGIRLNQFLIDATLMEEIPFTGTYLLSGESGNLCGKITATYHF